MNYWNQTPLLRLLPAFVFGILAGVFGSYTDPKCILVFSAIPLLIASGQVLLSKKLFRYSTRWIYGISVQLLVFLFAWLLTEMKTEIHDSDHFSRFNNVSGYLAYLDDTKEEKGKSYKVTVRITMIGMNGLWRNADGRCLVYFAKDSLSEKLSYGDLIVFRNHPEVVRPPSNPSQFDYKQWLSYNQVFHQLYLSSTQWKLTAHHRGNRLVEFSIKMRDKLLKVFRDNNIKGNDYAIVSALLLGDKDEIDQDILSAYAASGAMHVLCVSGLHVGIIYLAFNALLLFMDRNRKTKLVKAGLLILFLWFYAMLTGLSPAVLRSATMLSFIIIGKNLGRYANMYNTLAASAITLFCYEPFLLMQVGFQLSYLAVFGIVFIQPKIQQILNPSGWLWKHVWSLTTVSIAAQLATFPLGLFYFHQFPNYFLVSNLLVIPISTMIIYGGIVLFLLSPFGMLAKVAGLILGKLVHLLNETVIAIEHLPYSLLQGISITIMETGLIYLITFFLILFFMKKEVNYFISAIMILILIFSTEIIQAVKNTCRKQLVVYNVPKITAINVIEGKTGLFIADSTLVNNRSMMLFNILHYWWDCGIDEKHVRTFMKRMVNSNEQMILSPFLNRNFLFIYGKKIILLDDVKLVSGTNMQVMDADFLVISKNIKVKVETIAKCFRVKQFIIDSSNSIYHAEQWKKESEKLGIACYSVMDNGAFVLNLE